MIIDLGAIFGHALCDWEELAFIAYHYGDVRYIFQSIDSVLCRNKSSGSGQVGGGSGCGGGCGLSSGIDFV